MKNIWFAAFFSFVVSLAGAVTGAEVTRPNAETGPTDIFASIIVLDIDAVRNSAQSFEASVFYKFTWKDPRLAKTTDGQAKPRESEIWKPLVAIASQQNVWDVLPERTTIHDDGTVVVERMIWGSFSQPLNLLRFPFDKQDFRLMLITTESPEDIRFHQLSGEESGITSSTSVPDWNFTVEEAVGEPFLISENIAPIASFALKITAERLPLYYLYTAILPLIVITMMSFVVFWIEPENFGIRIGIASTSMLTVITYRVATAQMLPRTNYFTDLDKFIAGSTVLLFLALVSVVFVKVFNTSAHLGGPTKVDRWCRFLFPAALFVLALVSFD